MKKLFAIILILLWASIASATVLINESWENGWSDPSWDCQGDMVTWVCGSGAAPAGMGTEATCTFNPLTSTAF